MQITTTHTQLYCNMTSDDVAQHADKPWFVNLWFNDVHDTWAPDDDSLSEVMGHGSDCDDDRYLATIVKMDHTLGKLFDRHEQRGDRTSGVSGKSGSVRVNLGRRRLIKNKNKTHKH